MSATFLLRLRAFMIDYILILAYIAILFLTVLLFPSLKLLFTGSLIKAQFIGFLIITLPVALYFIMLDSRMIGQTFGKRKMRIKVVDQHGETPSLWRLVFRTMLKFLPWELSHFLVYRLVHLGEGDVPLTYSVIGGIIYALMIIYILTALFTKNKQSLYDIIVKTRVIIVS